MVYRVLNRLEMKFPQLEKYNVAQYTTNMIAIVNDSRATKKSKIYKSITNKIIIFH